MQSICSFVRDQLDVLINTRSMTVGLTELKRLLMIEELAHWYKGRCSFTLLQEVTLWSGLEYWSNTSRWSQFLFLTLRDSVSTVIHKASAITKDRWIITVVISELVRRQSHVELRAHFLQRNIAKVIYKCT